ncbi:hypothetical protein HC928_23285 [bacterium]|nr:hypothetical protein [bacterium]
MSLDPGEAQALLQQALTLIETLLHNGLAHGDLSAYNILYWEGEITLIDFPQVIDPRHNEQGRTILTRDITRVCEYFAAQGAQVDAEAIAERLWDRYCAVNGENRRADESRLFVDVDADDQA